MTPTETIREAARILRERAQATEDRAPSPWCATEGFSSREEVHATDDSGPGVVVVAEIGQDAPTAEYVASMHPAIALLFADLLDDQAGVYEVYAESHNADIAERVVYRALIAARAVLGTETTDA